MFNKAIRKFTGAFNKLEEEAISQSLPTAPASVNLPDKLEQSLDDELAEGAKQVHKELEQHQRKILEALTDGSLDRYAITGSEKQWKDSLQGGRVPANISIKSSKRPLPTEEDAPSKKKPRWSEPTGPTKQSGKGKKRSFGPTKQRHPK